MEVGSESVLLGGKAEDIPAGLDNPLLELCVRDCGVKLRGGLNEGVIVEEE